MTEVILDPYDLFATPIKDLFSLEDVILHGYSTDEEMNKTVTLTVREHPIVIPLAIDSLIYQGVSEYHSFIQRYAVYYGISLIGLIIKQIAINTRKRAISGSIREIYNFSKSMSGLAFDSTTETDRINIYMPTWCKEWLHSNSRYINMPAGRLAVYTLFIALNKSNILNPEVKQVLSYESAAFLSYIKEIEKQTM